MSFSLQCQLLTLLGISYEAIEQFVNYFNNLANSGGKLSKP